MQGLMQDFGWIRRGTEERLQSQKNPSNYCNSIDLLASVFGQTVRQFSSYTGIQNNKINDKDAPLLHQEPNYVQGG